MQADSGTGLSGASTWVPVEASGITVTFGTQHGEEKCVHCNETSAFAQQQARPLPRSTWPAVDLMPLVGIVLISKPVTTSCLTCSNGKYGPGTLDH